MRWPSSPTPSAAAAIRTGWHDQASREEERKALPFPPARRRHQSQGVGKVRSKDESVKGRAAGEDAGPETAAAGGASCQRDQAAAAWRGLIQVRTFCMTLAYAGCRLSEALALTADRVDLAAGVLVFESLKKRTDGIFRAVPVPPALLDTLDMVHGIREAQTRRGKGRGERLWPWSRMTGWRAVHAVMEAAGLDGPHASPKGLRHGFGVAAVCAGIPLNLVQKWLGHAQLTTTAIYANAVGPEEKTIASRMWG